MRRGEWHSLDRCDNSVQNAVAEYLCVLLVSQKDVLLIALMPKRNAVHSCHALLSLLDVEVSHQLVDVDVDARVQQPTQLRHALGVLWLCQLPVGYAEILTV